MKQYPNYITQCLECDLKIEDDNPKDNKTIICSECGAIHIEELCWTLKNTGAFKSK